MSNFVHGIWQAPGRGAEDVDKMVVKKIFLNFLTDIQNQILMPLWEWPYRIEIKVRAQRAGQFCPRIRRLVVTWSCLQLH